MFRHGVRVRDGVRVLARIRAMAGIGDYALFLYKITKSAIVRYTIL